MFGVSEHCIVRPSHLLFLPKHVRMISASPSTDLSAVEARQFACALLRQSPSAASKHTLTCTSVIISVMRPPTPSFPSAPQTPSSTPQSTHEDKHAVWSICTHTAQLTDKNKKALAMQADYGIFRIGDLSSVYATHGTTLRRRSSSWSMSCMDVKAPTQSNWVLYRLSLPTKSCLTVTS